MSHRTTNSYPHGLANVLPQFQEGEEYTIQQVINRGWCSHLSGFRYDCAKKLSQPHHDMCRRHTAEWREQVSGKTPAKPLERVRAAILPNKANPLIATPVRKKWSGWGNAGGEKPSTKSTAQVVSKKPAMAAAQSNADQQRSQPKPKAPVEQHDLFVPTQVHSDRVHSDPVHSDQVAATSRQNHEEQEIKEPLSSREKTPLAQFSALSPPSWMPASRADEKPRRLGSVNILPKPVVPHTPAMLKTMADGQTRLDALENAMMCVKIAVEDAKRLRDENAMLRRELEHYKNELRKQTDVQDQQELLMQQVAMMATFEK